MERTVETNKELVNLKLCPQGQGGKCYDSFAGDRYAYYTV